MTGEALYEDVRTYDRLGEHRTATPVDEATSAWLERRLRQAGMTVSRQLFPAPLFQPAECCLEVEGRAIATFPAWPVTPTATAGLSGALALAGSATLTGGIAVVRLTPGASWAAAGKGDAVMDAVRRGAAAVVAVTEGPTGDIIAHNTAPGRFQWPVPVVIAPGREGEALSRAAAGGAQARLVSTGAYDPDAKADNVVGRRPGEGGAVVVSTPKSGWFRCAGERGPGIAVFLALAERLVAETRAELIFVATSAHELGYAGGDHFVRTAPPPDKVKVWLHLGANVALQQVDIADGKAIGTGKPVETRSLSVSADLAPAARSAFAGLPGYATPRLLDARTAVGEVELFHAAGYGALAGLVGSNVLFHTPLDRAEVATTAAILEPVARACHDFIRATI